jgi:ferritin-like metal-binding protein YciE
MKLETLRDLFIDELKDAYDAETQIVKALPKMAKAATSPELQWLFREHLEQTRGHVKRLEQIFRSIGESARRKPCEGMKGLLEEGKQLMEEEAEEAVRDAGLIAGAQRVEHYEMAAYGSLKRWATALGEEEAAALLEQTLDEEKAADEKLSEIGESSVNAKAAQGAGRPEKAASQEKTRPARALAAGAGRGRQAGQAGASLRR